LQFLRSFLFGFAAVVLAVTIGAQEKLHPSASRVRVTIRTEADRAAARQLGTIEEDYGSFVIVRVPDHGLQHVLEAGLDGEPVDEKIGLGSFHFDPSAGDPGLPARFRDDGTGDAPRYYLVQFHGPVRDAWLESLRAAGLQTIQYIPDNAYLVRGTPAQFRSATVRRSEIRWTGLHHPAYKISDDLTWLLGRPIVKTQADRQRYRVAMFRAEEPAAARALVEKLGGQVDDADDVESLYFRTLVIELDTDRIADLAAEREVARIETWYPLTTLDERSNQISAGNYSGTTVPTAGYAAFLTSRGWDGTGITVGVVDDGVDATEVHLTGRVTDNATIRHGASAGASGHGHHDAGIIAGQCAHPADSGGFLYASGMAPQAHVINIPFLRSGYSGSDTDPQADIVATTAANGSPGTVSTNSWGTVAVSTSYGVFEAEYDALVLDASSTMPGLQPLAIVFSAGNSGPGAGTINSPQPAKNIFVVGATENYRPAQTGSAGCGTVNADNIDEIACFSSRGPAADSRIRPDITAPGTWIASALSGTNTLWGNIDAFHRYSTGTSQACPHVAGATALIQQRWKALNSGQLPAPAMSKAILINSAVDPTADPAGFVPNNTEGWGRLSLANAMNPSVSMIYDNQQDVLTTAGETYSIDGVVDSAAKPFRVTLVWSDAPGAAGANPALVNNLDLEVTVGGNVYKGNVFASGVSTTGGSADARNNVEAVYFPAGAVSGAFTITVRATSLGGDGAPGTGDTTDQRFALVVFNGTACPSPLPPSPSAATNGNNRIDVTWATVSGATSYKVSRATSAGGPYTLVGTPTASPYIDTNVTAYVTYYYVVRSVGSTCESGNSSEASATAIGIPAAPTNLSALLSGANVSLTWTGSPGPVTYRVYRAVINGSFSLAGSPGTTSFLDTTVAANTAYLYKVNAVDALLNQSPDSNRDLASTFSFTDPNLTLSTNVKAVHFAELRTAVNAVRTLAGLGAATFTDPALASSIPVKRIHLVELRSGVDAARSLLSLPVFSYADPAITATTTMVRRQHVSDLRTAVGAYVAPPPPLQLLLNPGFESGEVNWVATPFVIDNGASPAPRTGSWKAWLDGYGEDHIDTCEQQVSIPANVATANLNFWLRIDTGENPGIPFDYLRIEILNTSGTVLQTLATYSNQDSTAGAYVQKSFNVLAYAGQTIKVRFYGIEDFSVATSFLIDDTELLVTQ
jgi:hypothetical protein